MIKSAADEDVIVDAKCEQGFNVAIAAVRIGTCIQFNRTYQYMCGSHSLADRSVGTRHNCLFRVLPVRSTALPLYCMGNYP